MEVYLYQADLWCKDCGEEIREELTRRGQAPENRDDGHTYDSDEFPKGPFSDGGGGSDTPQHCAAGESCLNAITLKDQGKVGCWLENPVTTAGVEYIKEHITSYPGLVTDLWREWYREELEN